jgi:hypothetical protein
VGISNFTVFPDSSIPATIMLVITVGAAAIFTWASGDATPKIARYAICADFVICLILCLNLAGHWILAREVSAARQGVEDRHAEEDREDRRQTAEAERKFALKKAEVELAAENVKLQNAEARRLARLPRSEHRSALDAPKAEPTAAPFIAPMALVGPSDSSGMAARDVKVMPAPRLTPDQVRASWWWYLTGLAIAEVFASVLAGCILAGVWEWDKNHDGIPDHLQRNGDVTADQIRQTAIRPQMTTIGERTFRLLPDGRREVVQSTYSPDEVGHIWPAERDAGAERRK